MKMWVIKKRLSLFGQKRISVQSTRKCARCLALAIPLAFLLGTADVKAQLQVKGLGGTETPELMAAKLAGGGVSIFNVKYTGATNASGVFCSGAGLIGFDNGIVLTSGSITNIVGPNNGTGSVSNGVPGDASLDALIPGFQTHDASVLEFDFIPQGNQVQFNYVFGSEEYNNFVNSSFNDVFGFFVNGVDYALIPNTITPVAINNVNNGQSSGISTGPCMNCAFFIDNMDKHLNTQLNGLTVVLPLVAPVFAGATNHMKIAIADAGDFILDSAVMIQAGSLKSGTAKSATRTSRYWFTHSLPGSAPGCATLAAALQAAIITGCDLVDLGFLTLPSVSRYGGVTDRSTIALFEALGLYYRNQTMTGEIGGTQSSRLAGSTLCKARKQLAVELIAATANTAFLGTDPSTLSYFNGVASTNFPSDLLSQARSVETNFDIVKVKTMTVLLQKFNSSALTNDFPAGIQECTPDKVSALRLVARDPTTQSSCPGANTTCATAETIVFPASSNPFKATQFSRTLTLTSANQGFTNPPPVGCGAIAGGPSIMWKVTPDLGTAQFTVDTFGSGFDTLIQVLSGSCSNLVAVTNGCNDNAASTLQSQVSFVTDGSNTFFIVTEGANGASGRLKVHITSP